MIALDTNVWVRYLVEDDPDQTERATRVIEATLDLPPKLPRPVL